MDSSPASQRRAVLELSTANLVLRPIEERETDALHSIFTDERVRHFLWDDKVIPLAATTEIVEKSRQLFDESRFGIWGMHRGESDQLLGFAGYWYFRDPPTLELLFGVAPEHWGKRYATEASELLIHYGFAELDFSRIVASTDSENFASVRVLERAGMEFDRREPVDELDTVFYVKTSPS